LQHLSPIEALEVLKGLFSKQAQFGSLPNRQVVTASGSADVLQSIETLIEALDRESPPRRQSRGTMRILARPSRPSLALG
jgi:hypothetical protein